MRPKGNGKKTRGGSSRLVGHSQYPLWHASQKTKEKNSFYLVLHSGTSPERELNKVSSENQHPRQEACDTFIFQPFREDDPNSGETEKEKNFAQPVRATSPTSLRDKEILEYHS